MAELTHEQFHRGLVHYVAEYGQTCRELGLDDDLSPADQVRDLVSKLHGFAHAGGRAAAVLDTLIDGGTLSKTERDAAEKAARELTRAVAGGG